MTRSLCLIFQPGHRHLSSTPLSAPYNFYSSVGGRCEPSEQLPNGPQTIFSAVRPPLKRSKSAEWGSRRIAGSFSYRLLTFYKIKKWKTEEKKRTWSHVIKFRVACFALGMFSSLLSLRKWRKCYSRVLVFAERYRFLRRPIPVVSPSETYNTFLPHKVMRLSMCTFGYHLLTRYIYLRSCTSGWDSCVYVVVFDF